MVRLKHRYLLVDILYPQSEDPESKAARTKPQDDLPFTVRFRRPSSDQLNAKFLLKLIRDGVAELFGDYGAGMIAGSLQVKYVSPATSTAIVRVARDHYRLVWAALTFTTNLPKPIEQPCVIQVVRVSGTIKKAEEAAIRRARISIQRAKRASQKPDPIEPWSVLRVSPLPNTEDIDETPDFYNGIEDPDDTENEGEEMT